MGIWGERVGGPGEPRLRGEEQEVMVGGVEEAVPGCLMLEEGTLYWMVVPDGIVIV